MTPAYWGWQGTHDKKDCGDFNTDIGTTDEIRGVGHHEQRRGDVDPLMWKEVKFVDVCIEATGV